MLLNLLSNVKFSPKELDLTCKEGQDYHLVLLMAYRGEEGEERALEFLKARGYRIIARNYRWRGGEIDIIARDGESLAFIEVKARADERFAPAEEALTRWKRERLIRTAQHYIARYRPRVPLRFDVVTVVGSEVRLYKDAFRPEE